MIHANGRGRSAKQGNKKKLDSFRSNSDSLQSYEAGSCIKDSDSKDGGSSKASYVKKTTKGSLIDSNGKNTCQN